VKAEAIFDMLADTLAVGKPEKLSNKLANVMDATLDEMRH